MLHSKDGTGRRGRAPRRRQRATRSAADRGWHFSQHAPLFAPLLRPPTHRSLYAPGTNLTGAPSLTATDTSIIESATRASLFLSSADDQLWREGTYVLKVEAVVADMSFVMAVYTTSAEVSGCVGVHSRRHVFLYRGTRLVYGQQASALGINAIAAQHGLACCHEPTRRPPPLPLYLWTAPSSWQSLHPSPHPQVMLSLDEREALASMASTCCPRLKDGSGSEAPPAGYFCGVV